MLHQDGFAFDIVGDGLVVADSASDMITLLNPAAAVAWLALLDGASTLAELAAAVSAAWPDSAAQAGDYLPALLQDWQDAGWVSCSAAGVWSLRRAASSTAPHARRLLTDGPEFCSAGLQRMWSRKVRLFASVLEIEIWQGSAPELHAKAARMIGFLGGLPDVEEEAAERFAIIFEGELLKFARNGRLAAFPDQAAALSAFNLAVIQAAYPERHAHTIIHAGAVSRPSGTILIPAVSGSGKTTLTAHLVASGWCYGGDDVIGLARRPGDDRIELLPFPTALGIKQGSVPILMSGYPELASIDPVSYGLKCVRFTPVDRAQLPPAEGDWRVPRAFVFPLYAKDHPCELTPLPEEEALALLLESGSGIGGGTDLESFTLLLELIKGVPCFRLRYGRLAEAEQCLEALL